ncbi:MAG: zinc ribbon domain-containing protein [Verrucomicrobia bacterium]|nr:zinc ribbon domain-containing protein [Verrucomicrobiota bacterium]
MPTYEYVCPDCGIEYEVFQRMSESPLTQCQSCESPALRRKIGRGSGFIFKGGGFYETDFKDRKGTPVKETAESPKSSDTPKTTATPAAPCSSACACAPATP